MVTSLDASVKALQQEASFAPTVPLRGKLGMLTMLMETDESCNLPLWRERAKSKRWRAALASVGAAWEPCRARRQAWWHGLRPPCLSDGGAGTSCTACGRALVPAQVAYVPPADASPYLLRALEWLAGERVKGGWWPHLRVAAHIIAIQQPPPAKRAKVTKRRARGGGASEGESEIDEEEDVDDDE